MGTKGMAAVVRKQNNTRLLGAVLLTLSAVAGCSGNPSPGSPAYKEGELGNGDFLFACDDGVACLPYSGDAKRFPEQIATGSTFSVRFVANGSQGASSITINDKKYEGITAQAVAPYVGKGPDGFAALKPGYGTVVARDNRGTVIDYVTLTIVEPDGLVVYDANYDASRGKDPPRIQAMNLKVDDAPSYRVVAERKLRAVAGSIPVEWEVDDSNVVQIESYTGNAVNLRAKGVGKTKARAKGAALVKEIDVEVTE